MTALPSTPAQASPPSPTPRTAPSTTSPVAPPQLTAPTTDLPKAVARDLGIDWNQFVRQGDLSLQAGTIRPQLEKVPGFNDLRIENGALIATGSGTTFNQAAKKAGVRTRSQRESEPINTVTRKALAAVNPEKIVSIGRTTAGVEITVDKTITTSDDRQKLLATLPTAEVTEATGPAQQQAGVRGGQRLTFSSPNNSKNCLSGFTLTSPAGQPALLSAGHCTYDSTATVVTTTESTNSAQPADIPLGSVAFSQFGGPGNSSTNPTFPDPGTDIAIISVNNSTTASATVPATTSGPGTITGTTTPTLGAPACNYSTDNGWRCGTITQATSTFLSSGPRANDIRAVDGFVVSNISPTDGDSGGPVITGTNALGILSHKATINQTPYIYAVPVTALAQYTPNFQVATWIPEPTATGAEPAAPHTATAAWAPGQTITGQLATTTQPTPITITLDGSQLTTVTTDTTGNYSFTLPTTMTPAPARHTIEIKATTPHSSSTPLTVHLPWLVDGTTGTLWRDNGAQTGTLGRPTGAKNCGGIKDGGCYQFFDNGAIYWSPTTATRYIQGTILNRWSQLGWETGTLGYPTSNPRCGYTGGGCIQDFQHGTMYWQQNTGAYFNRGDIRQKYRDIGAERSPLGWPTSDETCGLRDNGCYQNLQNGAILWSPTTGAHTNNGAIRDKYSDKGYETGFLGYPTTDEICGMKNNGCRQHFQNGNIYFSPETGAHSIAGAIFDRWGQTGWETGALGYPTTDEICGMKDNGCRQIFWKAPNSPYNRVIYFSPATGAHDVIYAGILQQWATAGWENGQYGYPTSNPQHSPQTGWYVQQFQTAWLQTHDL